MFKRDPSLYRKLWYLGRHCCCMTFLRYSFLCNHFLHDLVVDYHSFLSWSVCLICKFVCIYHNCSILPNFRELNIKLKCNCFQNKNFQIFRNILLKLHAYQLFLPLHGLVAHDFVSRESPVHSFPPLAANCFFVRRLT